MSKGKITEAEWEVMEVLWAENKPLTSSAIIGKLERKTDWAPNTIRTLLARLVEKNCATTHKLEGKLFYSTAVPRRQCVDKEGKSFLARVFGGSPTPLLLHFARQAKFTPEELSALRRILDQKEKGSK